MSLTGHGKPGSQVHLVSLDLAARVDDALAVEAAAFGRPVDSVRRESYLRHTTYREFEALGAVVDDRLVGFGYGHVNERGQWWYDHIARAMIETGHDGWLTDGFVLVELHVLPHFQGGGIGRTLLTTLLGRRREAKALLSAHDLETPARRLYRGVGFADLLTDFRFPGTTQPFAVMGARLPLGQAS